MIKSTLFIAALVFLALTVDYLVKEASLRENSYTTWQFLLSVPIVLLAAAGWLQAMRMETLAGIGVLEASISVLGLIFLGTIIFGEGLKSATVIAAALALAAVTTQTIWG